MGSLPIGDLPLEAGWGGEQLLPPELVVEFVRSPPVQAALTEGLHKRLSSALDAVSERPDLYENPYDQFPFAGRVRGDRSR